MNHEDAYAQGYDDCMERIETWGINEAREWEKMLTREQATTPTHMEAELYILGYRTAIGVAQENLYE